MDSDQATRYFQVGQFSGPSPAADDFPEKLLECEEVTEDFEPFWGGAVYALSPDGKIREHKCNWDSSD